MKVLSLHGCRVREPYAKVAAEGPIMEVTLEAFRWRQNNGLGTTIHLKVADLRSLYLASLTRAAKT
jgi:hypothetical protein